MRYIQRCLAIIVLLFQIETKLISFQNFLNIYSLFDQKIFSDKHLLHFSIKQFFINYINFPSTNIHKHEIILLSKIITYSKQLQISLREYKNETVFQ